MAIAKTKTSKLTKAGWIAVKEIPEAAIETLENQSPTAIELFTAIGEIYEIFHHKETDRYMLITDGGGSFSTNAPGLLISTANPHRADCNERSRSNPSTMVFTIGLDDKTVGDWAVWVGAHNNDPERRPSVGYHYVS
jgi:hypothetical protein